MASKPFNLETIMETYESNIVHIAAPAERIYTKLADLENFRPMLDQIPADKVQDVELTSDSLHMTVDPVGKVGMKMVDKEPFKTIKLGADGAPIEFFFWIQLVEKAENDTKMKLTLKADIPFMLKMMVASKIKEGINKVAEALAKIPY